MLYCCAAALAEAAAREADADGSFVDTCCDGALRTYIRFRGPRQRDQLRQRDEDAGLVIHLIRRRAESRPRWMCVEGLH